jgi:hypothetical protein
MLANIQALTISYGPQSKNLSLILRNSSCLQLKFNKPLIYIVIFYSRERLFW